MLKLPRRRPVYYRNSYYKPPKRHKKISWVWIALSIPIAILVLEMISRLFMGLNGKGAEVGGNSPLAKAYQLQFLTETQKPIKGLSESGNLVVKRSSSVGYELLNNQKSQYLQINPQGFRDKDPVPLAKPKNEIRIFLLGGSTAFGEGTQKNEETISHKLETLLKKRVTQQKQYRDKYRPDVFPFWQPDREKLFKLPSKIRDGNYRVINAAVPDYSSGNTLAQFALEILPYQPDVIIILDGYSDLFLPSNQNKTEIPHLDEFLEDPAAYYRTSLDQSVKNSLGSTGIARAFNYLIFKPQASAAQSDTLSLTRQLPKDDAELTHRIQRYQENYQQLLRLATKTGVPVIIAIQPEITGRPVEQLSPAEKVIRDQLGRQYLDKIPKTYNKLLQSSQQLAKAYPKQVKVQNLYSLPQKLPPASFSDAVHLTDKGNTAIAQSLYNTLTSWDKMQIIPANFYLKTK